MYVLVDGFGEGGEDVSSSSPSVDSTTPGDLDTLNIPSADVKTKFDMVSTGDGSYGMLDPTNSANSSTSKGSDEAMDSEEEPSANTRLNEKATIIPKSEGEHPAEPEASADGLIATVKTDQDVEKVDQNRCFTPAGSPPDLLVAPLTSQRQQQNVKQEQNQPLVSPGTGTEGSTPETDGSSVVQDNQNGNSKELGGAGSVPNSAARVMGSGDKGLLNGVIKQGPQNVTITTPARMNAQYYGGGNVYQHGQPFPKDVDPSVMFMPQGGTMTMSANITFSPMTQQNNVSPSQAGVPHPARHPGYTSFNQQGNYPHPGAQMNPQMSHQGPPPPSMNGQGFAHFRSNMNQNNGMWYGQAAMGNDRRGFPQRRAMRNPMGMPQYSPDVCGPQGFPSQGPPPHPHQGPHGFENQYNQMQKDMAFAGGPFKGQQNMQNFSSHFSNSGPGFNHQPHAEGNYIPQANYGGGGPYVPGAMGSAGPAPVPPAGVPVAPHLQQGTSTTAAEVRVRVDGSFTGYQGNQLTHFPAGREPPTPPAGPGVSTGGQVPSTAVPVNSNNTLANSNQHHTQQQRSGNVNGNYGPHINSSPHPPPHAQLHNQTVEPQQIYASLDPVNINPCTPNNTPPFNAQYNGSYSGQQQSSNQDNNVANNQVASAESDITEDIPEFSMFGDYAPQPDYY